MPRRWRTTGKSTHWNDFTVQQYILTVDHMYSRTISVATKLIDMLSLINFLMLHLGRRRHHLLEYMTSHSLCKMAVTGAYFLSPRPRHEMFMPVKRSPFGPRILTSIISPPSVSSAIAESGLPPSLNDSLMTSCKSFRTSACLRPGVVVVSASESSRAFIRHAANGYG